MAEKQEQQSHPSLVLTLLAVPLVDKKDVTGIFRSWEKGIEGKFLKRSESQSLRRTPDEFTS